MQCPKCKADQLFCIDSRPTPDSIKRRRKCGVCGYRFLTFEITELGYTQMKTQQATLVEAAKKFVAAADIVRGLCDA